MLISPFGCGEDSEIFDITNWEDLGTLLFEEVLFDVSFANPVELDISDRGDFEKVLSRRNLSRSSPPSWWSS